MLDSNLLGGISGLFRLRFRGRDEWAVFDAVEPVRGGGLNAHHPIIHTLFLGATIKIGLVLFGSFNAGVAFSVVVQAVILLAILFVVFRWMLARGLGKAAFVLSVAYFSLDPVIGYFAFTTTKDVLFSMLLVLYCLSLYIVCAGKTKVMLVDYLGCTILGFFVFIMRTNALVAIVLVAPLLAFLMRRYRRMAFFLISFSLSFLLALAWLFPLSDALGVERSPIGIRNALCVFNQHLAYISNSGELPDDDQQELDEILGTVVVPDNYVPNMADRSRSLCFKISTRHLVELSLDYAVRYPGLAVKALMVQTEDAWSPFCTIDCYSYGIDGRTDVLYLRQEFPSTRDSKLPLYLEYLHWVGEESGIERIPLLNLIVSVPFYNAVALVCLGRCFIKRNNAGIVFMLPLVMVAFSSVFGPCVLIRYFLYLFFALPLMVFISFGRHVLPDESIAGKAAESLKF